MSQDRHSIQTPPAWWQCVLLCLLMVLASASACASAQSKLEVSLLRKLRLNSSQVAMAPARGEEGPRAESAISVLVTLESPAYCPDFLSQLQQMGLADAVTVQAVGPVIALHLPVDRLQDVAELPTVASITASRQYHPTCFSTRQDMRVPPMQELELVADEGFSQTYTGKGVLVAVIDVGIEFNHLNFRNPQTGETRLRGAVLYRPKDGDVQEIREFYTDPLQLDTLTTDTQTNSHGTITAGVAAGSYPKFCQQGVAPDADLMLCATSVFSDERLIDALQLIFARADELGIPCVVNLSIGNPLGWKDGLSPFCLACDALTEGGDAPGRVIVLSSGNDGDQEFAVAHSFVDTQPVLALLQPSVFQGQPAYVNPNIDLYCDDDTPLSLDYVLYDTLRQSISPCPFEQHLLDTLEAGHDGRRHLCLDADTCLLTDYPHQLLAVRMSSQPGAGFVAYYIENDRLSDILPVNDNPRWLKGTTEHSISDLCCTDAVLSVGAYSAVDEVRNVFGRTRRSWAPRGEICSFSSYGITWQGTPKPDVICPGTNVVSSFSSYYRDKIEYYYLSQRYLDSPMMYVLTPSSDDAPWYRPSDPDRTYYWAVDQGTSLSSPALAGVIALWLQADPTLSVRQIRALLQHTSRLDDDCLLAPAGVLQAGWGKADALAGMKEILHHTQAVETVPAATLKGYDCCDLMGRRVGGIPSVIGSAAASSCPIVIHQGRVLLVKNRNCP